MTRSTPTVYDVAGLAGVSIATVSRVVKDHPNVADETRRRVRRAIDDLQWRPSSTARALAERTHDAVGIIFPDLAGHYYAEVIRGFERRAVDRSAVHILATHGRAGATDLVRDLAERVDGLVVMGETVSDEAIAELVAAGRTVVTLARSPVPGACAVRSDNTTSAIALVDHLVDVHDQTSPVFLGDPGGTPDVRQRHDAIAARLVERGHARPTVLHPAGFDVEDGAEAFRRAWRDGQRPAAVTAANDQLAIGVATAAGHLGVDVGTDLALTGWDDQPLAALLAPGLTTVAQPMARLGACAADALFRDERDQAPDDVVLPTRLVVRGSCGCDAPPPPGRPRSPHDSDVDSDGDSDHHPPDDPPDTTT